MWYYKLTTAEGEVYYYDSNEYSLALRDKNELGGIITNRRGEIV